MKCCELLGSSFKEDTITIPRNAVVDLSLFVNALFKENEELKAQLENAKRALQIRDPELMDQILKVLEASE